jgi:hypothetical protein
MCRDGRLSAEYAAKQRRTLRGGALRARLEVLGDNLAGRVFTAATAGANWKLALDFEQGARAVVNGIANLTVTHCVADADIHRSAPRQSQPQQRHFTG